MRKSVWQWDKDFLKSSKKNEINVYRSIIVERVGDEEDEGVGMGVGKEKKEGKNPKIRDD